MPSTISSFKTDRDYKLGKSVLKLDFSFQLTCQKKIEFSFPNTNLHLFSNSPSLCLFSNLKIYFHYIEANLHGKSENPCNTIRFMFPYLALNIFFNRESTPSNILHLHFNSKGTLNSFANFKHKPPFSKGRQTMSHLAQ